MTDPSWQGIHGSAPDMTREQFQGYDPTAPDPDLKAVLDALQHLKIRIDPHYFVEIGDYGFQAQKVLLVSREGDKCRIYLDGGSSYLVSLSLTAVIKRLNGEETLE